MKHSAEAVYFRTGLLRRGCMRGFWALFFVRLVTEVQLSPLQLVLLGTVMEVTILTMEIPTGVVADTFSRKWSVIASFLIVGAAVMLSAFATPYWLLVLAQALIGFGSTFETGAETAWITSEVGDPETAEPIILRRARWQLVAAVVGIVFWAGLAALTSLSVALFAIGLAVFAWGCWLIIVMQETSFVRSPGEGFRRSVGLFADGLAQARRIRPLTTLVTVVFIGGLAKEAIDRLDVQRLVDIGLPTTVDEVVVVGVISAIRLAMAAGLLTVARHRASGSGVVAAMAALLAGIAVGIALLAHMELLALAGLGLILQGGFSAATEPLVITWTNTFASDSARATVHSFMGQAEAFGEILGGIALGVVAELATVPTAMTVSAVLFAVAAVVATTARGQWSDALEERGGEQRLVSG